MRLIDFDVSPLPQKRYMVKFAEPSRVIHFGTKRTNTFIDHGDRALRHDHFLNKQYLFESGELCDELLTTSVLWGPTLSVEGNLAWFLKRYQIDDSR
jgi:hypothetical protein